MDLNRSRIEGLLAAFPKLISIGTQHTFVETESVRYVYQPLEQLYMVVITTKNSNIIEDLDTLHMLARLIPEHCRSLTEEEISKNVFELVFAFDEVVQLGQREKITLPQVKTFLEMDSHEEKIAEMIEKNKQREAKEEAKRRQTQIEKERAEAARFGRAVMGGGGAHALSSAGSSSAGAYASAPVLQRSEPSVAPPLAGMKRGMVLKKAAPNEQLVQQLVAQGAIASSPSPALAADSSSSSSSGSGGGGGGGVGTQSGSAAAAAAVPREAVHVSLDEKLVVLMTKDNQVETIDVKGELTLTVSNPEASTVAIRLQPLDHKGPFKFLTHPHINKPTFQSDSVLALRDPAKGFPSNMSLGLLKWRHTTKDDDALPMRVMCWVSPSPKQTTVTVDYELINTRLSVRELQISLPVPGNGAPAVTSGEGSTQFSAKTRHLSWTLPLIESSNGTGQMEFTVPYGADVAAFFPLRVTFSSATLLGGVQISSVVSTTGSAAPVPYSVHSELIVEQFDVTAQ